MKIENSRVNKQRFLQDIPPHTHTYTYFTKILPEIEFFFFEFVHEVCACDPQITVFFILAITERET